jgi:hypothetical protein
MNNSEYLIYTTFIDFLIFTNQPEAAAIMVNGGCIREDWSNGRPNPVHYLEIPASSYQLVADNSDLQSLMQNGLRQVLKNHNDLGEDPSIDFRIKRNENSDPDWEAKIKNLIAQYKGSNQGFVSELMAAKNARPIHTWNELRYASKSEIAIAQELEKRKVMFFPLAVAVRADTGILYKDHREVDFLICNAGKWGIIEVAYHPDRYEVDNEKNSWFMKSGIKLVKNYTAEKCYNKASEVIDEFLFFLNM